MIYDHRAGAVLSVLRTAAALSQSLPILILLLRVHQAQGPVTLCGKLGRLRGVAARAAYSSAGGKKKETRVKNDE